MAALTGIVVHATLDELVAAIGSAGCITAADVVEVLRAKGGISLGLETQVRATLERLADNPRMEPRVAEFAQSLRQQVPEMRQVVQSALARVMGSDPIRSSASPALHDGHDGALGIGLHPEVKLAPTGLPWIGWADAIRIGEDTCEIIDYKSGTLSHSHHEQLRTYALLWARDRALNPAGRLADILTLVYPGKTETWQAPREFELQELEADLNARTATAVAELEQLPPPARVSTDACRFCDVKQLCGPYWSPVGQESMREATIPATRSVQAVVGHRRANRSWDVTIELDPYIGPGEPATLVLDREIELRRQDRLRIIDVWVSGDESATPTLTAGSRSEIFKVP